MFTCKLLVLFIFVTLYFYSIILVTSCRHRHYDAWGYLFKFWDLSLEAEELRVDIYSLLRYSPPPKPNLSKEKWKALKQLKSNRGQIILIADKGVPLVVMDRQMHIKKTKILLDDSNTYRWPIPTDPTNKHKARFISILKKVKTETGMGEIYP